MAINPSSFRLAACGVTVVALMSMASAIAGPCDAHFTFDGDLFDNSGNGHHGELVAPGGEPATTQPVFVPGKFGQALELDGQTVMFSPLNLQTEDCPQVTIAAWVYVDDYASKNTLVSTGYGRGPRLDLGRNYLSALAGSGHIRTDAAPVRRGRWIFVAGTWDYESNKLQLFWQTRSAEAEIPEQQRPPQEGLWVGGNAYFTALHYIADGLLIDEMRVWGRVLSEQELREVQAAGETYLTACDCGGAGAGPGFGPGAGRGPIDTGYVPPPDPTDLLNKPPAGAPDLPQGRSGGSQIDWGDVRGDDRPPLPIDLPESGEGSSGSDDEDEGSGSTGQQPPASGGSSTGVPRPTGAPAYSSVAGNTGGNKRMLDLEKAFIESIWWSEKSNRPCFIRINGQQTEQPYQEALELGCDMGLAFHAVDLYDYAIGRLDVCNNDNANGRLKGMRIFGTTIKPDGTTAFAPVSDEEALPNCRVWSPSVLCPGDKMATGLVVHSNDASGRVEQIVGLQLICRDITVE